MVADEHEGMPRDEEVGEVRLTRGFVAFLVAMVMPAIVAVVVVAGATLVADEVYAADAAPPGAAADDVAGWKHTIVGICPIH